MGKHCTLKVVTATAIAAGVAMHYTNKNIIKNATSKDLLKKEKGTFYSFKYGKVFYKVSGQGSPILLLHDLDETSSGMEWFYLENKLSKTNTVYTLDLLGCGRSDRPKLNYNCFLYIQLINDFIKEVIGEKTDIIATGKTAAPVIMTTKLAEESINRIILINPADLYDLSEVPDTFAKAKRAFFTLPVIGTFAYHLLHSKDQIFDRFINDYYSNPNAHFDEISDYYYEAAHKKCSGSKYLYASIQGKDINMNINHALKVIDKDIIIISGEDYYESDYVPNEYAELNENIEFISIMETAYLPQLEAPSKVMDIISQYWK